MPEIAEVERARTILEQILKDQTIIEFDDPIVFKDCAAKDFEKVIKGKKVVSVKRWGKYFWLEMESPPHPVLHFAGMTGWIRVKGAKTHYYPAKDEDSWPPRFVKFILKIAEPETRPSLEGSLIPEIWGTEIAFVDARRLGRVRLVDAKDPFTTAPLNELGFDPILKMPDFEWFAGNVKKKKVPIKALLLDQSFSAGVGNWVAYFLTEDALTPVLYQSRIHPEQYCNTLPNSALKTLHEAIRSVTTTAAEVLGDSSKFPADWLFSYRWGKSKTKGKKGQEESNVLPNGEKIKHITVGGRTSAVVESRQKKIKPDDDGDEEEMHPPPKKGKKAKEEDGVKNEPVRSKSTKKNNDEKEDIKRKAKEEVQADSVTPKKRRVSGKNEANEKPKGTSTRKSSRSKAS